MRNVTNALSILLLVAIVIFAFQNMEAVDVTFLVFSMKMPKILLILLIYFLGMISGWSLLDVVKRAIRNLSGQPAVAASK